MSPKQQKAIDHFIDQAKDFYDVFGMDNVKWVDQPISGTNCLIKTLKHTCSDDYIMHTVGFVSERDYLQNQVKALDRRTIVDNMLHALEQTAE